jgi:hypothetical protein
MSHINNIRCFAHIKNRLSTDTTKKNLVVPARSKTSGRMHVQVRGADGDWGALSLSSTELFNKICVSITSCTSQLSSNKLKAELNPTYKSKFYCTM